MEGKMRHFCDWKIGSLILAFGFLIMPFVSLRAYFPGLRVGFYDDTCPQAETIVSETVQIYFEDDPSVPAALLRLFFHDCFVRGCDASILLDSNVTNHAEKDASPNFTVRGFDLIDTAKSALETVCPGTVSCADIIALAARDAVVLANGPQWKVRTGRRDGRISLEAEAHENLPDPSNSAQQGIDAFAAKGLSVLDFVCLLGAHTIGVSHCRFFSGRLFNFAGTGRPDPSMNPKLATKLKKLCPDPFQNPSSDPRTPLDQGTPNIFDTWYFKQLVFGNGILRIDQETGDDSRTTGIVRAIAGFSNEYATLNFSSNFAASMINLGNVEVKTGSEGEIRLKCNVINS